LIDRYEFSSPTYIDAIPATIDVRKLVYRDFLEFKITFDDSANQPDPPVGAQEHFEPGTVRVVGIDNPDPILGNQLNNFTYTVQNDNPFAVTGVTAVPIICDMSKLINNCFNKYWATPVQCGAGTGVIPPGLCVSTMHFYNVVHDTTIPYDLKIGLYTWPSDAWPDCPSIEINPTCAERGRLDVASTFSKSVTFVKLPIPGVTVSPTRTHTPPGTPTPINSTPQSTSTQTSTRAATDTHTSTPTGTLPPTSTATNTNTPRNTATSTAAPTNTAMVGAEFNLINPNDNSIFTKRSNVFFYAEVADTVKKIKYTYSRDGRNYSKACERDKAPWGCFRKVDKIGNYIVGVELETQSGKEKFYNLNTFTVID